MIELLFNPFSILIYILGVSGLVIWELSKLSRMVRYGIPLIAIAVAVAIWIFVPTDPMKYILIYGGFGFLISFAELIARKITKKAA